MDIVVWGAGLWGERCMSFLPHYGINVIAFIDSDENKIGNYYLGKPVVSLASYEEDYKGMLILLAVRDYNAACSIENMLKMHDITYFLLFKCPSELYITHVHEKVPFKEYLENLDNELEGHRLAVSGWNLFSLLLYDYLNSKGAIVQWIVTLEEKNSIYSNDLERYCFLLEDDIRVQEIERIFCTSVEKAENVFLPKQISFYTFDIFRYRNAKLQKFRNIYNGQRCFVVANGPSLRMDDLQCLHEYGELCFGVNGIYHAFSRTCWRPNFYVASDPRMFESFNDDVLKLNVPYKFLSDSSAGFWNQSMPSNVYRFHLRAIFDMSFEIPFSEDISVCTYDAGTVMHSVLQFAVYMGFKEIYIIGADCQLIPGKPEHFDAKYCEIKGMKYRLATDMIFAGYEAAKKYADAHGIKIYNATRGGALEVFERVNFDEIFNKAFVKDI